MKKMKGGSYLRMQVWKNLAKAAACLLIFLLVFVALSLYAFFTLSFNVVLVTGFAFTLAPLAGFYYFFSRYRIYSGGWQGEKLVIKTLDRALSDDYILLNDLLLQGGGGDIDHIVLAPGGVFVLETKHWSGEICCNGDEWQRAGKNSFKSSPSRQVKRNACTIRHIIESLPTIKLWCVWVEGIVVFTNTHATLHLNHPTVPIVKLPQLPTLLEAPQNQRKLTTRQLEEIGRELLRHKR